MAGDDLSLKAVIETALDPKGFEDFKTGLEGATTTLKGSMPSIEAAGGAFQQLGNRLPHAAFHLLSYDMLENMGIHGHMRPLVMLSTTAMEGLAEASGLAASQMAMATVGVSLLVPLISSLMTGTKEAKEEMHDAAMETDGLIETFETLEKKTGTLTTAQREYLGVLRDIKREKQEARIQTIKDEIEAQEKLKNSTDSLVGGIKAFVAEARPWLSTYEIAAKSAVDQSIAHVKASTEVGRLTKQLAAEEEALKKSGMTAEDYAKHLIAAAEAARRLAAAQKKTQEEEDRAVVQGINERNRLHREAYNREVDLSLKGLAKIEKDEQQKTQQLRDENRQRMSIIRQRYQQEVEQNQHAGDVSQQVEENKREAIQQTVASSIEFLGSMFGHNKAASIANAIMNTYEGATKALAEGGAAGPAMAAAVIATGMADVATIEKQDAGFDDPGNDSIVREAFKSFGRGWAADMTQLAREGAAGGFGEGLQRAGAVTNNSNSRTTINRGTHIGTAVFNSLLGTPGQAMAAFERRRIRVARKEDRTRRRSL